MCAPMPQRGALMVLYAFNIEVSRAPWVTQEELIAEMRLQWWKDAIAEIYDGKTVRSHEVVTPLQRVIDDHSLPRELFDQLIDARRFDIYREPHASADELDAYIKATSANVMELAGKILGAEASEPFATYGYASGLANLLVALPDLYGHGRKPIPFVDADQNALTEGRLTGAQAQFIQQLARDALGRMEGMKALKVPRAQQPALLAGWAAKRILTKFAHSPPDMFVNRYSVSRLRRSSTLMLKNSLGLWR